MIDNPFVTNGYAGPEYFCDRVEETAMLTSQRSAHHEHALHADAEGRDLHAGDD